MAAAGRFPDDQVESVLVTARDGGAPRPGRGTTRRAASCASHVAGLRGVTEVTPAAVERRHARPSLVDVHLKSTVDDARQIQARTAAVARAHPELRVREAGDVSVNTAINDRVAEDLHSAEGISLPITLLLMLLAFGALIAAGVPVLLALTSVAATMGITAPLSHLIHAEPTVTSMIVLIGMAVGVDYSLFYLKREREERAKGHTTLDAVEIAAATSGHSIMVSGAAVIASMAGLFIVGGATFDSLAVGRDRRGGGRGRSARSPCCRRCWPSSAGGSTARGSLCCGGSTVGSGRAGSAAASWLPSYAVRSRRSSSRSPRWSPSPLPALGMKTTTPTWTPSRTRSPRCRRCTRSPREFPAQGTTATVVVHGAADRARPGGRRTRVAGESSAATTPWFDPAGTGRSRPLPTARPCG